MRWLREWSPYQSRAFSSGKRREVRNLGKKESTDNNEYSIGKSNEDWVKFAIGVLCWQPEIEAEHETCNNVDTDCDPCEDQGVAAHALILIVLWLGLHLNLWILL